MERISGFTLVELLFTVAIISILTLLATPSLSALIQDNRLITHTNEFIATLHFTRSEAIRRGERVTLCKGTIANGCDKSTQGWEQGWLIFVDHNDNGLYEEPQEILLRTRETLDKSLKINANGQLKYHISYLGSGLSRTATGALPLGSLAICGPRGDTFARAIVINRSGRARMQQGTSLC